MKRILVTGGTVFASRFTARWFVRQGYEVYVLNRGTRPQVEGTHLIQADRHALGEKLKPYHFDAVLDICGYTAQDVNDLLDGLGGFDDYLLISSSAVYPETNARPFTEAQPTGPNSIWGQYGMDKIAAEAALLNRVPQAYVLRPPYLYGPMQNLYREPFVFECALENRPFYIPGDGSMRLQFFHIEDLCRLMEKLLLEQPDFHILNVGNPDTVDIHTFVAMCYQVVGSPLRTISVDPSVAKQRDYFCFHDYDYYLDVSRQKQLLPQTIPLLLGLEESYVWYHTHQDEVRRKPLISFIDQYLKNRLNNA